MLEECNGNCICVYCNLQLTKTEGKPCRENKCPQCGKQMMREGSYHHQLYLFKKGGIKNEPPKNNSRK